MTRLATTPPILGILVGGMLAAGCGSNQVAIGSQNVDAQASGLDATAGRGGAVAGGSGGSATGGATGGVTGSGGGALTGGTVGVGGATPSGGTAGVGSGGSGGAGGSKASGGTTASGGSKASGGTIGTGGATGTGGSGSGGTTTTCALVGESCVTSSCCGPLICLNWTGSSICFESIPPPADSGTGQGGTGGAGGGAGGTGGAPNTGGTGGVTGTGGTGGSTGKICGPMLDGVCADGEICNGPPGACNLAGWTGTCVVKPQGCTADWQPVCGCDGKTYSNDCMRLLAGVSKKNFDGACPTTDAGADGSTGKTCGGFAGVSCPTNQFCDISVGLCNSPDAAGTCVVNTGVMCPMVVLPVCGCNGKTYNNDCERQVAGVSKKSDGACPTADGGALMTPTLPAACQIDGDCCVAMDTCTAMAYLVGRTEFDAMVASIPSVSSRVETCVSCIQPAVQVQCNGGFCAGEKLPISSSTSPLTISHCGYISVSDAGTSTVSAHAAVDAGTAAGPSTWSCQTP